MGLPKQQTLCSVDEYLTLERAADERHEYLDGQIFAMAGESDAHGIITMNVAGILYLQLKGKHCQGRIKDTKVRSGPESRSRQSFAGMFSYPDFVIICDEPEYHDEHRDVLLNPTGIVEVLSPSTDSFDRGEKFERFKAWNPTFSEYVLISQDEPRIEHHSRQADGQWSIEYYTDLEYVVKIEAIQCELKLADVYERVVFDAE